MHELEGALAWIFVLQALVIVGVMLGPALRDRPIGASAAAELLSGSVRLAATLARGCWHWAARLRRESRPPTWEHRTRGHLDVARTWGTITGAAVGVLILPFRGYALLRSHRRARFLARWLREIDAQPCPPWIQAAAERLQLELSRYGIRDRFQVRRSPGGDGENVLGWYPKYSQFEAGQPVFAVTRSFVPYVLREYERAGNDPRDAIARDLTRSAVYLLAHEYGHVIAELALVLHGLDCAAWVGLSPAKARRLCQLILGWREGRRGREEAFCDDLATFVREWDPSFLGDDSMPLREAMAPHVQLALRLHAELLSGLGPTEWSVLRDIVRARVLAPGRKRALPSPGMLLADSHAESARASAMAHVRHAGARLKSPTAARRRR